MTGEDLQHKPGAVKQAKFYYSLLGKFFNKGWDEKDKKEGLLKRLKNVEGKDDEQLKAIKDHGEKQLKALESNADSANTTAFQSLKFLNRLGSKTKNGLMKLRR